MDRRGSFLVPKCCHFILIVSFSFFLYSYFSGFPFFYLSYNLQLSSLIFPLFARALDRKYMFLVCNGIVVFLTKTGMLKSAEDGVKQISELPAVIKEESVRENAPSMEYTINLNHVAVSEEQTMQHPQQENRDIDEGAQETKMEGIILESREFEEENDETKIEGIILESQEFEEDDETKMEGIISESQEFEEEEDDNADEDGNYLQENKTVEVNEARVSTEELNQKFEEFIRKMKEEIRIEAQQQLITV